jgi:hypothetical protein
VQSICGNTKGALFTREDQKPQLTPHHPSPITAFQDNFYHQTT